MRRLLFHNFYLAYRLDRWLRVRFTPAGRLALGALIAAGVFGVNTRATLAYQTFALTVGLLVMAMIGAPLFRARFSVERRLPPYATVGEPAAYTLVVRNRGAGRQIGLTLAERLHHAPPTVEEFFRLREPEDGARNWFDRHVGYPHWAGLMRRRRGARTAALALPDLPPGEPVMVEGSVTPVRRGRVTLDGLWLLRTDPLGLFNALQVVGGRDHLLVLPRRYPVTWVELVGTSRDRPGGMSKASSIGGTDEFASLREYRPGDALRHIDWKGWARLGEPIVKEFHEQCFVRQALVLDTFLPSSGTRAQFETAVSLAASFACAAPTGQGALDLLLVGTEPVQVSSGPGLGSIDSLLEALACAEPARTGDVEALCEAVLELSGELSACVCVFCDWDTPRRELVARLRGLGLPLLVLVARPDDRVDDVQPGPMADQPGRFRAVRPDRIEQDLGPLVAAPAARGAAPAIASASHVG